MKVIQATLPWLLVLVFSPKWFCYQAIHCQWGPYGEWSACDPCTKLQSRTRTRVVYAQFGGNPCAGQGTETRTCQTTQGCPLEEGCGDRFRCRSGKCISRALVCNGDQDCEGDNQDELVCDSKQTHHPCLDHETPPNIELLGLGFDAVSETWRGAVINTMSFGGQCRKGYHHQTPYRLPLSTIMYNFEVKVKNDYSDEEYISKWHYAKDIVIRETVKGTTNGFSNYDYVERDDSTQHRKLMVLKNNIEVGQFQNNAPQYLPISEEFWRDLAKLPTVYDYSAYRKVLSKFGTHYLSEGVFGGFFEAIISINQDISRKIAREKFVYRECEKIKRWILFFPITHEKCIADEGDKVLTNSERTINTHLRRVNVDGGDPQHIAALKLMDFSSLESSLQAYSNWAASVTSLPQVIQKKLRPLSELVKDVQCAGVKKLFLRRAIEQYLDEAHSCHCRPCRNNGLAVMKRDRCECICKPGTQGLACEQGSELEGQQGVIHGHWSCWSSWASCSGSRRSRSRTCSNPAPQNGGQNCIGESTGTSECEDKELTYFRTMEPQCFDMTLPATEKCPHPPALINGYVLNPKDIYLVGNRVEYSCIAQYNLIGNHFLECTAALTWSGMPGLCTVSRCRLQHVPEDVIVSPQKAEYNIGERITLSCPVGQQLLGETEVLCDASLHFSPAIEGITCSKVQPPSNSPNIECEPWQKIHRGKCICRMLNECAPSLEVCGTSTERVNKPAVPLTVCKLRALQCLGKRFQLAENSTCQWPARDCTSCHMWETCDDQNNVCRCKDSADCVTPGVNVCVHVGRNVTTPQTMTECDAGHRRCKGEMVSVVSLLSCDTGEVS